MAANAVTAVGLAVSVTGAVVAAVVDPVIGGIVFLAGSALDALDGPLARVDGSAGRRGALFDTVADRIGEVAIWTTLAWVVVDDARLTTGVVLALGGSLLTSFLRARADAAGVDGRAGIIGRAERVILVAAGLITGWIGPMIAITVVLVWVTVALRFRAIWRALA